VTSIGDELGRIAAALERRGRRFAVVGGLAVSAVTEPRLTRDVDCVVAVRDDRDAEALVLDLGRDGYRVRSAVEQVVTGRLATARLEAEGSAMVVDLLFASCGIEEEVAANATRIEVLPGVLVPVASPGDLIAMKLLARDDRQRPLDADDLRGLSAIASEADWARAAEAAALIEARGYGRGRDLGAALRRLRTDGAY